MVCVEESNGYRCRKCPTCLSLRRRTWVSRMIMENRHSESAWFLTLTYNDENIPLSHDTYAPVLRPKDVQLYIKRLRASRGGGLVFRYFLCGEYGDRTLRPHYHAILFFSPDHPAPADLEETVNRYWGKGHTLLKEATIETFSYVSHYVMKKANNHEFEVPEFQRMSTNPALGTKFIEDLANQYLNSKALQNDLETTEDVRKLFRHNGQVWPIDPYLRNKLREQIGVPKTRAERQEGMSLAQLISRNYRDEPTQQDRNRATNYAARTIRKLRNSGRSL